MARTAVRWKISAVAAAGLLAVTACTSRATVASSGGEIASFTVGNPSQIASLDPLSPQGDFSVADLVIQPLADWKADGTLVPKLASHVGVTDRQITFDLRPGLKFTDGTPVTADDAVASIKRAMANPAVAHDFKAVSSVTAEGQSRVVVSLSQPDVSVLPELVLTSQVMEKKQLDATGTKYGAPTAIPVGAGPYKVGGFTTTKLTLVRNENYWGPKPNIKSLSFIYVPDQNTAQLAMRSGTINLYWDSTAQQIKAWNDIPGATTTTLPSIRESFVSLDTTHAPFDDIHVRRAIAHAIDRKGLVSAILGGHAEILRSLLTTAQLASISSRDEATRYLATLPDYDYDIAKAKAELAQSSHPNGFSVAIPIISTDAVTQALGESMEQTLKPLGISITLKAESTAEWNKDVTSRPDKGMEFSPFFALTPQPGGMLPYFIGSGPAATFSFAHYAPAELDRQLSILLTSNSKAEQFAATKTIVTAVANDLPYIPVFAPDLLAVTSKGFALAKNADLDDLYTDQLAYDIVTKP